MDNIKAYIRSGILELYALGDVSAPERLQVEQMAIAHPAVLQELLEVERALELYAAANAVAPAGYNRKKLSKD